MAENRSNSLEDHSVSLTNFTLRFESPPSVQELLYRARAGSEQGSPLILLLHGRGGNRGVMWAFAKALPAGCAVLSPEGIYNDPVPNFPAGKSWWLAGTTSNLRNMVEPCVDLLQQFVHYAKSAHQLRPRKIIAVGFSQGAALISAMIQLSPGLLDGAALVSGFVVELLEEPKLIGMPVFMAHGTKDAVAPIELFHKGKDFLQRAGASIETSIEEVGHKIGSRSMRELSAWLSKAA